MAAKKKKVVKRAVKKKEDKKKSKTCPDLTTRIVGACSYILFIGVIVLLVEKKNAFMRFHAKHGAALTILYLIPGINVIAVLAGIYGFITALMCRQDKFPLVYDLGDWIAGVLGSK